MRFPALCRELRIKAGLKQAQVAEGMGVKPSTYANMESNNHRTVRLERAELLAVFFQLDAPAREEFLNAWRELPESDYTRNRSAKYEKHRKAREKLKRADQLNAALIDLAGLLVTSVPDAAALCICEPPTMLTEGSTCELCTALKLLGLNGFTTRDDVIAGLASLSEIP